MDVHPPLAKLLITLAGWLAGFNGDFDFKDIGKDYLEPNVPYVAMRMLPAVMGIMTIPTMFLTLKATGCRTVTAALGAGLLIFGMDTTYSEFFQANSYFREWFDHSISLDSPRFSSGHFHRPDCSLLDLLHKSA
jgi:dolichyl-phosphate-mannose--protein O-mannosyl transferase